MKHLILFLLISLNYITRAQNSFYFKHAMPPDKSISVTVDERHFGVYVNEKTDTRYVFNKEGVFMETIVYSFITREQVRESSKYSVRNGFLFGIKENDSIPYIEDGDNYVFGIKQKKAISEDPYLAKLKKENNAEYYINFSEQEGFTPTKLVFDGTNLILSHFTYSNSNSSLQVVQDKVSKGNRILLNPDTKEWIALDKKEIFEDEVVFKRQ